MNHIYLPLRGKRTAIKAAPANALCRVPAGCFPYPPIRAMQTSVTLYPWLCVISWMPAPQSNILYYKLGYSSMRAR